MSPHSLPARKRGTRARRGAHSKPAHTRLPPELSRQGAYPNERRPWMEHRDFPCTPSGGRGNLQRPVPCLYSRGRKAPTRHGNRHGHSGHWTTARQIIVTRRRPSSLVHRRHFLRDSVELRTGMPDILERRQNIPSGGSGNQCGRLLISRSRVTQFQGKRRATIQMVLRCPRRQVGGDIVNPIRIPTS